jgi:hypothetical protein
MTRRMSTASQELDRTPGGLAPGDVAQLRSAIRSPAAPPSWDPRDASSLGWMSKQAIEGFDEQFDASIPVLGDREPRTLLEV